MDLIQRRVRRFESIVSLCLLGGIVLIGLGVFVKQFDYEMSQFGMDVISTENSTVNEEISLTSLSSSSFETLLETEVYDSETLYEKINGKAPFYTESGFRELVTQRFVSKSDEKLWAELYVYDMGSVRNAYSVYSRQKRPDGSVIPEMKFAYLGGNSLFAAHGQYYIEFVGSTKSKELSEAMQEITRKFSTENIVADVEIEQMQLFGKEDLVAGSIKLYLNDAFGFDGLDDVFTGQYKIGDDIVTVFLSERPSSADAKKVVQQYHKFLLDNGGVDISASDAEIKIVDFYGTIEIVGTTRQYIFGIHEAENRQAAEQLAEKFSKRLNEK